MKRTYTPSLEEISYQYGERYFTVSIGRRHRPHDNAIQYGTLEEIVYSMDATIYNDDPDADPADYSARISYEGRDLVYMPDCAGPDSAQVCPQPAGTTYDIRQVDAWRYDDEWVYNNTYHLGTFTTAAKDTARAFRRALRNLGIVFVHPHQTVTVYDGDVYEIIDRKTGEPMFCVIPREV